MQLFYAPDFTGPQYTLPEEESKHCVRVLRLRCGDVLHLTDGRGNLYVCRIADDHPKRCRVEVLSTETQREPLGYRLQMAVAPTKNADRYEWFLEKATEIGCTEFVPLESRHSERRSLNPDRCGKVVVAAMKQSLKRWLPELRPLTPFSALVAAPFEGRRFIAHCDRAQTAAGKRHLAALLKAGEAAQILIGPEGDFSPEEIAEAVGAGFEEITLGRQRLRTETAATVAVSMVAVLNDVAAEAVSGPASETTSETTSETAVG